MALIPRDFDFTFPDFDSIKLRVTNAISSVLAPWTNYLKAMIENVVLEAFCFNFDVLMGYMGERVRETRIATARSRPTMRRMAFFHNTYRASEVEAATATVTLSIPAAVAGDVTIPAGTEISTEGPDRVVGQLLAAAVILAGQTSVNGSWEHSTPYAYSYASSGLPGQRFPLDNAPYLWESATLEDDSGGWDEQEYSLADSQPTDTHFVVEVTEDGFARIVTGDQTYGAIPSGTVSGTYKTGGGADGNVAAGSLKRLSGTYTDSLGTPVTVSVTNALDASGGDGKESVEQIRIKAPAALRAQERSVSKDDMESNAERVVAVARALVVTVNEDSGIPENTGHVYAVGFGATTNSGRYRPAAITAADKAAIRTMLQETYPVPITFETIEQDTVFETVTMSIDFQAADGFVASAVAQAVYDELDDLFAVALSDADGKGANTDMAFGNQLDNELLWGLLFTTARGATGVRRIDEDTFQPVNTVALEDRDFPLLGTVTITDLDTNTVYTF